MIIYINLIIILIACFTKIVLNIVILININYKDVNKFLKNIKLRKNNY